MRLTIFGVVVSITRQEESRTNNENMPKWNMKRGQKSQTKKGAKK
jgi:hypothetical protein